MTIVTYIDHQGTSRSVEAAEGASLMTVAVNHGVPGIDGDCGGAAACGTCHVHVDTRWLSRIQPPGPTEEMMLSGVEEADERSRLACQIRMTSDLDGIVVHTPRAQH